MAEQQPSPQGRSQYDALMDLITPGAKSAEAAPWSLVSKVLKYLGPRAWEELGVADKAALEALTEMYPAVRRAPIYAGPQGMEKGSAWRFPTSTLDVPTWAAGGENLGSAYKNMLRGDPKRYFGSIRVDPASDIESLGINDPAVSYAHEAGHVLGGPLAAWTHNYGEPRKGVSEGFAEGLSNVLLDRYNKDASTWYWPFQYKKGPEAFKKPYIKAGYLGKDVGSEIRSGNKVDQQNVIELLLDIIKQHSAAE